MKKITTKELLAGIFIPTIIFSAVYLALGYFCKIPHLLLFCLVAMVLLIPMELGTILKASKEEFNSFSLKSALEGQEKLPIWQIFIIAFCFFGMAGLFSALIAPLEAKLFEDIRTEVLHILPMGFDWTDFTYLKSFSRPVLILTCVVYGIFNVFIGPVTEELYFRGYLTSHYEKQNTFTPIWIAILFSLYHLWLPFNNIFRIFVFVPAAYVSYRKKCLYISLVFHCMCNLLSTINFARTILG